MVQYHLISSKKENKNKQIIEKKRKEKSYFVRQHLDSFKIANQIINKEMHAIYE